jgi:flagellar biosynthesis protein FlhF
VREAVEPMRGERTERAAIAERSDRSEMKPVVAEQAVIVPASVATRTTERSSTVAQPRAAIATKTKTLLAAPPAQNTAPAPTITTVQSAQTAKEETKQQVSAADAAASLELATDQLRMRDEIGQLRHLLESQLSSLAWNDLDRRQPLRARVLRDLTRFGIEADVANTIVEDLPHTLSAEQSRYLPLGLISRRLRINPEAADLSGVLALVGATGAGKTTTLAKLAARHVQKHGRQSVALIGCDDHRVGAQDQLLHYGRALGVQTFTATGADELSRLLTHLGDRELVLIDTPGMSVRDARLPSVIDTLKENSLQVRTTLVLPVNVLPGSLEHSVRAFAPLAPSGCILTKLDEAPSPGGALSIAIRHNLALEYVTAGQRVPEDIDLADARRLVCLLADEAQAQAPDELVMAQRFGRASLARS